MYRMGALGDTLLLSPLCQRLRAHSPGVRITLAANPRYAAPLLDSGLIHRVLDGGAPPFHLLYDKKPSANDPLNRRIREYDAGVFYTWDRSGELGRRLSSLGQDAYRVHPPFPPGGEGTHVCEWMARPWGRLPAPARGGMRLHPSQASLDMCDKILNAHDMRDISFFVIHPGSGGKNKWPPPGILVRMGREYAAETGHRPILSEGPADAVPSGEFQRFWGDPLPVMADMSPQILGALLARSSAYIGGDSGVSHLASLYAPRATVLYGPHSDMAVWRPAGAGTRCLPWEAA